MSYRLYLSTLLAVALAACSPSPEDRLAIRRDLAAELMPVALRNCEFERIGDPHDGGYVMCGNLLAGAKALYSYGISGTDEWGCQLSARLGVAVHQYDCFNPTRPACVPGASPVFHDACVGPRPETIESRLYDTIEHQVAANGDAGKPLVMKMDVEGSEWPSFLAADAALFGPIDQLVVEFHDVNERRFVEVLRKLKTHFHVANVHFNNWSCDPAAAPLPSLVFEVLFVNKRIGVLEPGATPQAPNPLDAPNKINSPDCQAPVVPAPH